MSETDLQNITPTYYKIEIRDQTDDLGFIKTETFSSFDDSSSISQYIIRGNYIDDRFVIPSTSTDFNMLIEEVKHEPEEVLHDLILPDVQEIGDLSEYQQLEPENVGFEIIEEQAVAYEVKRNAQGELECPICSAIFKIGANLERHIQIHEKKFVFSLSKPADNSKLSTEQPATIIPKPLAPTYPCEYCSSVFEYKKDLRKHLTNDHKNRRRDIKCQMCLYCTDNKHHFREHLLRHKKYDQRLSTNPELVRCIKCPALLKNDRSLKLHEKHVHSSSKFQCAICDKLFKTKPILKHHIKSIHSVGD